MNVYKSNDAFKHKIYLAGPFFNEKQLALTKWLEESCKSAGLDYFSPRERCCCPPDASMAQRKLTFDMNTNGIENCDLVLACIDDYDAGTMWEMGYAHALNKKVVAYSMVPGRGLNLMLAQSCVGFINGEEALKEFIGTTGLVNWEAMNKVHEGEII